MRQPRNQPEHQPILTPGEIARLQHNLDEAETRLASVPTEALRANICIFQSCDPDVALAGVVGEGNNPTVNGQTRRFVMDCILASLARAALTQARRQAEEQEEAAAFDDDLTVTDAGQKAIRDGDDAPGGTISPSDGPSYPPCPQPDPDADGHRDDRCGEF
jgi:hypothetical protein